jgi:hypothetical protein|tara:strand:+ start:1069 stop:1419 length:351 start_codon:yes stop_codon:yes gene_type:complete
MNFIEYESLIFANLADQKTVLLSVEKSTFLNAVNICNTSETNIRINLQIVRLLENPKQENFLVKNVLIQPNESHNLMSLGNLEVFLKDGDNLLCFSNGYSQLFDCTICYTELNEQI